MPLYLWASYAFCGLAILYASLYLIRKRHVQPDHSPTDR